jgi:RNA polymerase sigma-70 factor, ECF subfamily
VTDAGATDPDASVLNRSMDDETLCRALALDVDSAFERLVLAHQDRVYALAWRVLGDAHDAEEVAQDAFVRAYRALGSYEAARIRELRLRPWLSAITVNLARNRRRRLTERRPASSLGREIDAHPTLEPVARVDEHPDVVAVRRAGREALAGLLAALPERYRIPVVLRYVDDLSYPEMAEVLGRPEGTLKAQVHRGLALLRDAAGAVDREELTA